MCRGCLEVTRGNCPSYRLYKPYISWWPQGTGSSWAFQEESIVFRAASGYPTPDGASHQPFPQGGRKVLVGQFRITDPLSPKAPYLEGQEQSPSLRV